MRGYQVALLIILVSVCALLPSWLHYDIISNDGAFQYIPVAELFLLGRFREALLTPQLPLFPLLIAGASALTGLDPELSGRMIAAVAFVIAALGLYRVSMLLFQQRWIALLAVLFMITNRELVDTSVDCLKESLLVALIIWGNYGILLGVRERRPWHLIAGVLLLLAGGLLRSTALFFVGAWLILWAFHRRRGMALRLGIIVSPAAAIVLLWFIDPTLPIFIRSYNLDLIFKPDHTPLFLLAAAGKTILEFFITGNPVIILFAGVGLYAKRDVLYARHALLVLLIYLLIMTMWGHVFSGRYLLAPIVWVCPLAAYAVQSAWQSRRMIWKTCAVVAVLSCAVLWTYQAHLPPDPDKLARKVAGRWILARIGPDQAIASNRPRLVFYAKGRLLSVKNVHARHHPCLAVDIIQPDGERIKAKMDQAGVQSDAAFRTIFVYLPRP